MTYTNYIEIVGKHLQSQRFIVSNYFTILELHYLLNYEAIKKYVKTSS